MSDTHLICIAPMLDYTDRHARYLLRLLSPHARLYSEMVVANAIIYGDADYHLNYNKEEHPIALQLGGSDPDLLMQAAVHGQAYGYDEINLNIGCPSDRVKKGRFGACLMREPSLVAECVDAINKAVNLPVTIKCRIGVDHEDSYDNLRNFVLNTSRAGCDTFIIHARKAWLKGLSPKQNREIPPLRYDVVYRLKQELPHLRIVINGGIKTVEQILDHQKYVDGVMIGREAYHNPAFLMQIEKCLYTTHQKRQRSEILEQYIVYMEDQLREGVKLSSMARHLLGLYHGESGARAWRRMITENSRTQTIETLHKLVLNFNEVVC